MKIRSLKLSKELDQELTGWARARGTSGSAVVREALVEYLSDSPGTTRRGPKSFAERAIDLAGTVELAPDLSTSSAQLEGYGKPRKARESRR